MFRSHYSQGSGSGKKFIHDMKIIREKFMKKERLKNL